MEYSLILSKLIEKQNLEETEASKLMNQILEGQLSNEQIAGILVALRSKGETLIEIVGFAKSMREHAIKIPTNLEVVDTCGTGGDKSGTFNISTTAAFIASGAGVNIGKHHNRSVSSKCGSADVLEELGINISAPIDQVKESLEQLGIGFCFAPMYHQSLKHAVVPRRELGIRTVFNLLGPLLNPFLAKRQVVGIFDKSFTEGYARILQSLGSQHVIVLHGLDGLDEFSLCAETIVTELRNGEIKTRTMNPEMLGFQYVDAQTIKGGDAKENAAILQRILEGEKGPMRDIAVLNAAFVIYVSGKTDSLEQAVIKAQDSIDGGAALEKLNKLKQL